MSLWMRARTASRAQQGPLPDGLIPPRTMGRHGSVVVTDQTALRHSAVWACLRLRADLIASMPLDCFRHGTGPLAGIDLEVPTPPVLVDPGGKTWDYVDWMWATQHDLDRTGNAIGLISERDGNGMPSRIDLQPIGVCTVIHRRGEAEPRYKIDGKEYAAAKVWHERQFPTAGLPVGLSPIAFAALSIGEGLSLQQFALDWFGSGAVPKAHMRNAAKTLDDKDARLAKRWYRDVIDSGDVLVTGKDWEYAPIQAEQAAVEWLDARQASIPDIGRFFGVPADLLDAAVSGSSLTYANIIQRNLQFLIMNLGPAVQRREKNLSKLLPRPRFVKLNTGALLRMDPETMSAVIDQRIRNRTLAPTEARALWNLPPLTEEQRAEFDRLFGPPKDVPASAATQHSLASQPFDAWLLDQAAPRSPMPIDR